MQSDEERPSPEEHKRVVQLSSPDQLDDLLVVTTLRTWIVLGATTLVLVCLILWFFFGSVPIRVNGRGLMMNKNGLFDVQAQSAGTVLDILVSAGDTFDKDAILVRVGDPQIALKLRAAENKMEVLQHHVAALREQIESEADAVRSALQTQLDAAQFTIRELTSELPGLKLSFTKKKELLKDGLITQQALNEAERIVNEKEIELENTKAKIKSLHADLSKAYRSEELKTKEQELLEAVKEKELLVIQADYGNVRATRAGKVLEVIANTGEFVQVGGALVWAEAMPTSLENQIIYGYVPVEIGKRLTPGVPVTMEMSTVSSQEYGYMRGIITAVSLFPVSPRGVLKTIQNDQLVRYLVGDSATVQILIDPVKDSSTASGFAWTSGQGPPFSIPTGTVCTLKATVEYVKPLYYVFPMGRLIEVESGQLSPSPKK